MYRDESLDPPALVCQVGKTQLRYHLRAIEDLHAMLKAHGDWVPLGSADEQKPAAEGTVEAWARSEDNPVGGWYGLKKGLRGRFGELRAAGARGARPRRGRAPAAQQPDARDLRVRRLGARWYARRRMETSRDDVLKALEQVIDPELRKPVTELDMVRDVRIEGDEVAVTIALTVAGCPLRSSFQDQVQRLRRRAAGRRARLARLRRDDPGRAAGADRPAARRRHRADEGDRARRRRRA